MKNLNRELGTDAEMDLLVQRIKGFNYEDASLEELVSLSRALQVLAEDIVQQQQDCRKLNSELTRKLSITDAVSEMSGVVNAINNTKRNNRNGWLPWR